MIDRTVSFFRRGPLCGSAPRRPVQRPAAGRPVRIDRDAIHDAPCVWGFAAARVSAALHSAAVPETRQLDRPPPAGPAPSRHAPKRHARRRFTVARGAVEGRCPATAATTEHGSPSPGRRRRGRVATGRRMSSSPIYSGRIAVIVRSGPAHDRPSALYRAEIEFTRSAYREPQDGSPPASSGQLHSLPQRP